MPRVPSCSWDGGLPRGAGLAGATDAFGIQPANAAQSARRLPNFEAHSPNTSLILIQLDGLRDLTRAHGPEAIQPVVDMVRRVVRSNVRFPHRLSTPRSDQFLLVLQATSRIRGRAIAVRLRRHFAKHCSVIARVWGVVAPRIAHLCVQPAQLGHEILDHLTRTLEAGRDLAEERVCTPELIAFERAADLANVTRHSVVDRLDYALRRCDAWLGRNQREHLTDHGREVSDASTRLGAAMRMPAARREVLRVAGLCHDLGKLLVPEEVLAKPGPLDADERALLATHANDGADMAAMLHAEPAVVELIRRHHDRFDGDGVEHPGQTEAANILAVADAFVAMTSERPYQKRRPFDEAMVELRRCCGSQFDPAVVQVAPQALRGMNLGGGRPAQDCRAVADYDTN